MSRWIRIGAIVVAVPILALAVIGGYVLVDSKTSGDKPPFSDFLLAKPAFAQAPASALTTLENEAGLSAYMRLSVADRSKIDLNDLTSKLFTRVVSAGDNYVLGYSASRISGGRSPSIPSEVLVYIDTAGWILAALPQNAEVAEAAAFFGRWGAGSNDFSRVCSFSSSVLSQQTNDNFASKFTILECALGVVTLMVESPYPSTSDIQWYDWEFPDATHLVSGGIFTAGVNRTLTFAIPAAAEWKDASIFISLGASRGLVFFDGSLISDDTGNCRSLHLIYPDGVPLVPSTGDIHSIVLDPTLNSNQCSRDEMFAGFVGVYKFP